MVIAMANTFSCPFKKMILALPFAVISNERQQVRFVVNPVASPATG